MGGHVERTQNNRTSKKISVAIIEGIRKRGKPHKNGEERLKRI